MNTLTKIACRTIGTAGMGLALFDASKVSNHYAHVGKEHAQEKYLEKAYYSGRTIDKVSYSSNMIREKTFDLRTKNPLPAFFGSIGGRVEGFLYGIGNTLPLVACSSLALLGKNVAAKAGAIGIAACLCLKVLRDGFGLGKQNPMS